MMPDLARSAVLLAAAALCLPSAARACHAVRLSDGGVSIVLDPCTLRVSANVGGRNVPLSDAGPREAVTRLRASQAEARWDIAARDDRVTAALHGNTLDVTFQPKRAGRLLFPRLGAARERRAFLLPIAEGAYVPAHDRWWAGYLTEHGPEDTLEGLTMPFVGVDLGGRTATYIFTNRFHNRLAFDAAGGRVGLSVTHETEARPPYRAWTVRIVLAGPSPVEPARVYRRWLKAHGMFVSMREKIRRVPETAKLLGAAQAYVWGGAILSRHDVKDWHAFCRILNTGSRRDAPFIVRRAWQLLSPEARSAVDKIAKETWPDRYATAVIAQSLSDALGRADFDLPRVPDDGSPRAQRMVAWHNSRALAGAFPGLMEPPERWGDGVSVKMMERLAAAGLTHLWLGLDSWDGGLNHPEAIRRARALGYLVAPYDSYNSIHAPGAAGTWATAQFDEHLYDTGAVVRGDGTKQPGFQKKGYILSALAAFPYVKKRVSGLAAAVWFNSWFLDTDAFGQLYDDYSPLHPGTQGDDMRARLRRIAWIRDTFRIPVGSEGGSAYAASAIAYEQGVSVPSFGWGDADLKDRASPYFLGAYYPPDGPAIFLKPVPPKDEYVRAFYDPRFRLPLYETVFHDSVVTTRHWSAGSLKFTNVAAAGELSDVLYQTPPLYHWNLDTFEEQKARVVAFQNVFSPLHERTGVLPMTSFEWLTPGRLVQRTRFGDEIEITANFGDAPWKEKGRVFAPHTAEARWLKAGKRVRYAPPTGATAAR
jgi:hypothetical protein